MINPSDNLRSLRQKAYRRSERMLPRHSQVDESLSASSSTSLESLPVPVLSPPPFLPNLATAAADSKIFTSLPSFHSLNSSQGPLAKDKRARIASGHATPLKPTDATTLMLIGNP